MPKAKVEVMKVGPAVLSKAFIANARPFRVPSASGGENQFRSNWTVAADDRCQRSDSSRKEFETSKKDELTESHRDAGSKELSRQHETVHRFPVLMFGKQVDDHGDAEKDWPRAKAEQGELSSAESLVQDRHDDEQPKGLEETCKGQNCSDVGWSPSKTTKFDWRVCPKRHECSIRVALNAFVDWSSVSAL